MSNSQQSLAVRAFMDEVLIQKLPPPDRMRAQMFVRSSAVTVAVQFQRVQPYVTPKIELSDQRAERADLRVLPVVFRFDPPKSARLYPGQLVDVYIWKAFGTPGGG
jgi:HlyD family secretion protein